MTPTRESLDPGLPAKAHDRQRIWVRLLRRASRRDNAVSIDQSRDVSAPEYARKVWLAEEAMALVLRMANGEF